MKRVFLLFFVITVLNANAQDDVYPAAAYSGLLFLTNGTVHIGNGAVIENATIEINNGKIIRVGQNIPLPADDVKIFDVKGKQVYPGLILPASDLGLKEIASGVRGSNDYKELGDLNPNVRSIVAYNTASSIINVLKANGILLANTVPQGGVISGSSSVVQLDAWTYDDAAYQADGALHIVLTGGSFSRTATQTEAAITEKVEALRAFFNEAQAYLNERNHQATNLKFEALKNLFTKKQTLFVHADNVKQMLAAIALTKDFGFRTVIVGGRESWLIAPLLKENNIGVILNAAHSLPDTEDADVDQPFKTPFVLQQAGVLFALNDDATNARYRNLAFNAGTAAAYGLSKEEALAAITLNAAQLLGIADKTGSLEAGKDANIVVSEGDILDMKTSIITMAFIQGRKVSLENKQTQLNERYMKKYGLN